MHFKRPEIYSRLLKTYIVRFIALFIKYKQSQDKNYTLNTPKTTKPPLYN